MSNPWEPLGLPATWAPQPIVHTVAKLEMQTPAGPETWIVLIIDTSSGRQAYKLSPDEARALGQTITEKATGLTIARDLNGRGTTPP